MPNPEQLEYRYLPLDRRGLDKEKRVIPIATLSTETPIARNGEMEVLDHSPEAVDLSRAQGGLPLLYNHDSSTVVGIVENVRLAADRTLKGMLRFGRSVRAREVWEDVADGVLTSLSIGFAVHEVERTADGYRAIKWTPHETSIVACPADIGARIGRNHHRGKTTMENQNQTQTQDTPRASHEQETQILTREQQRRQEIRGIFNLFESRAGIRDLMDRALDDPKISIEAARKLLLEELGRDSAPLAGNRAIRSDANLQYPGERGLDFRTIASGYDATRDFQTAAVDALLLRNGIKVTTPHVAARDLARMSVVAMAEICLRQAGLSTSGLPADRILQRAITHTSSDFPKLLGDVAHKSLMQGFENEQVSHRQWVRNVEVSDFRPQHRIRMGSAPDLIEVSEGGEIKHGSFDEKAESYQLRTFARLFTINRTALINDDLTALTKIPESFGRAGARKEADVVYGLLLSNPVMAADAKSLFHEDHGNISSPSLLLPSSLGEARTLMRLQKNGAKGFLNIIPRFLLVPPSLETEAELLINSTINPEAATNVENARFIRNLQLVVEPRLEINPTTWYLIASPEQDTCETAYLSGQRGVFVDSEESFETLGQKFRAVLDFGAGILDWAGFVRNQGG